MTIIMIHCLNGQQIDHSYVYLNNAKLVMKRTTYHNIYDYCFSQLLLIAKATQSLTGLAFLADP